MHWKTGSAEQAALRAAYEQAAAYLEAIQSRRVAASPETVAALERLGGPLPEQGLATDEIVARLGGEAAAATTANAGPRFFGFVNGGALPASLCASWLVSAWDQNGAMHAMSPAAAGLESIALEWARELLGLGQGCAGAVVTGATMANLTGLAAARHALLARADWDVEADGLQGSPPLRIVAGEEVHPALLKALGILGLGKARVERVPVDDQGRMRADALPLLDSRTILCLQAGNVNTGAFDPAPALVPQARAAGAWVHVDGAFGLWAAAAPAHRHWVRGYELADSWATDGHKWPNLGYDCGLAFVRDGAALRSVMSVRAAYLPEGAPRDPMDYTPECSRRARGVELWAALRSLGRGGMADLVDRCCRLASRFAEAMAADGHEVLNEVAINQVLISFGSAERTEAVVRALQDDGTMWAGPTRWQGRAAMRFSVSSWATTAEDIDRSVDAVRRAVARLA